MYILNSIELILSITVPNEWQTMQFTEMEPDLTILHKSYKYSCYQSWSTCSWFHILDSHDIILGSLTNIRDFMETILTVHRFMFCRYFLPSSRQKKDGSEHSIHDIYILSGASKIAFCRTSSKICGEKASLCSADSKLENTPNLQMCLRYRCIWNKELWNKSSSFAKFVCQHIKAQKLLLTPK